MAFPGRLGVFFLSLAKIRILYYIGNQFVIKFCSFYDSPYLVAIHLLIPQLEEAIRNTLEIGNIPTLKPNKSGKGFQLRILDEMLRDPIAVQLLTDDFANYLRILLTDNRGWNLRNDICHGIASPDLFNKITADRIIHALLCFGVFRIKSE